MEGLFTPIYIVLMVLYVGVLLGMGIYLKGRASSGTIKAKLRLNGGQANSSQLRSPVERLQKDMAVSGTGKRQWKTVRIVDLEELPEKELATAGDGWCNIEMPAKKILTLEFLAD